MQNGNRDQEKILYFVIGFAGKIPKLLLSCSIAYSVTVYGTSTVFLYQPR